jgi:predicted enzyme related to lactoylglutathione lyase
MVLVYVKDLPAAVAFYARLLDLEPDTETRSETWAEFHLDGATLGLHAIPVPISSTIEISVPPAVRDDTPIKWILGVADLGAVTRRLETLGVAMTVRPWGEVDVVDPEGNVLGMTQLAG